MANDKQGVKTPKNDKSKGKDTKVEGFEFRGESYKFAEHASDYIRVMGGKYTKEEIANDEELLVHLIGGNSSLIEKI